MEMINWDDYEDTWFAQVKDQQKQWLLDRIFTDYRHVDLKSLSSELAAARDKSNIDETANRAIESSHPSFRVLVKRT